ncbi:MAG: ferrous iron transport protein A [Bacteroidetes bacterium]|nr:ferrous iron transport protein A [Bacteroidota bacterium]
MNKLTEANSGDTVLIINIRGDTVTNKKLADMGVFQGERIRIIDHTGYGGITISVKGSKLSLGHGLAEKIWVKDV